MTLAKCVVHTRALGQPRLSHDPESTSGARGGSNGPVYHAACAQRSGPAAAHPYTHVCQLTSGPRPTSAPGDNRFEPLERLSSDLVRRSCEQPRAARPAHSCDETPAAPKRLPTR